MVVIISLCLLFWVISFLFAIIVMIQKLIYPSFWSWFFVLCPIVNTYISIAYFRIKIDKHGFRDFWKKLKG